MLAGQAGDYLLPPDEVSLLLHVALVRAYDRGAYYPEKHFQHFIGKVAGFVAGAPGCRLLLDTEVRRIVVERGRVTGVETASGEILRARRYVSNLDPQRTLSLVDEQSLPANYRKRISYEYSCGTITVYLAVRGIDLRDHGFGSHNTWHYPHDDIGAIYRRQRRNDFDDPWLFLSTPTLHTDAPGLCPPGEQILEIATSAEHAYFSDLRQRDRRAYNLTKKTIRDRILAVLEEKYVPGLSRHIAVKVTGTPATNERFCGAPRGNSYGAVLTPANIGPSRIPYETPLSNLWMVNATAGFPSIGGTVRAGMELHSLLRGRR